MLRPLIPTILVASTLLALAAPTSLAAADVEGAIVDAPGVCNRVGAIEACVGESGGCTGFRLINGAADTCAGIYRTGLQGAL